MKIPEEHNDLAIPELIPTIENLISKGCIIHLKFTCEKCGARITADEPNSLNVLYPDVPYDEMVGDYFCECGYRNQVKKFGFMLITGIKGGDK